LQIRIGKYGLLSQLINSKSIFRVTGENIWIEVQNYLKIL